MTSIFGRVKVSWIRDTPNDCFGFYTRKQIWINHATCKGTKQIIETLAHEFLHYVNDFAPLELEIRLDALLHKVHGWLYAKASTKKIRLLFRKPPTVLQWENIVLYPKNLKEGEL